jgi:hypothetical protein
MVKGNDKIRQKAIIVNRVCSKMLENSSRNYGEYIVQNPQPTPFGTFVCRTKSSIDPFGTFVRRTKPSTDPVWDFRTTHEPFNRPRLSLSYDVQRFRHAP